MAKYKRDFAVLECINVNTDNRITWQADGMTQSFLIQKGREENQIEFSCLKPSNAQLRNDLEEGSGKDYWGFDNDRASREGMSPFRHNRNNRF